MRPDHVPASSRSVALAALHRLALPALAAVTYTAAAPVFAALVLALCGADAWAEVEPLARAIRDADAAREALAVLAEQVATVHGPTRPGCAAPLRELARLLRVPLPVPPVSMLAADEPPSCLAGGVTTRRDVGGARTWSEIMASAIVVFPKPAGAS